MSNQPDYYQILNIKPESTHKRKYVNHIRNKQKNDIQTKIQITKMKQRENLKKYQKLMQFQEINKKEENTMLIKIE